MRKDFLMLLTIILFGSAFASSTQAGWSFHNPFNGKRVNVDPPKIDVPPALKINGPEVVKAIIPKVNGPEVVKAIIPKVNGPEVVKAIIPKVNGPEVVKATIPKVNGPEVAKAIIPKINGPEVLKNWGLDVNGPAVLKKVQEAEITEDAEGIFVGALVISAAAVEAPVILGGAAALGLGIYVYENFIVDEDGRPTLVVSEEHHPQPPGRHDNPENVPSKAPFWQGLKHDKDGRRTNGKKGKKKRYYGYDRGGNGTHYPHLEVWGPSGNHLGVVSDKTGEWLENSKANPKKNIRVK